MLSGKTYDTLQAELAELKAQLQEANDAIEAIRSGEVDAVVVKKETGHQLYTLKGADHIYRVFIEKMKEGAVTLNRDGIILYSNSQFASVVGLPLSNVIGIPIGGFIPPEFHEAFQKIIREGWVSDSKGEVCFKNSSNQLIPFHLSVTALELDEGEALSIFLTDMTAQKENEKQLGLKNEQLEQARVAVARANEELEDIVRERTRDLSLSREYFKSLADNIPVIVWTTQADGSPDYFNKKWFEYTGISFEESRGAGSRQVFHPDDFAPMAKAWTDAVTSQTTFQFEYRIKRAANGEYRWHLAKAEPLRDENGILMGWFGTSTDIEGQKKEMEKKDEFIGVASHELKTPLTSLKGYIQLIRQIRLPDPAGLYIEKANSSLNKLQHLINDLLDVSRIQAGKLKFDTTVFDLSALLHLWVDNSRHMHPSHDIKKELDENIFINGNEERLEQVVMNLINNAVKYSPGNKNIIIRATKDDAAAMVSVTDFGIGLSAEDQAKVFDRFYQVASNGSNLSGLGMGLYISSEIIREHQGTLSVKSKLNKGATFSISLPLVVTE